jgi:predicted nuclease of predicted toxin-antitoxin system
MLRLATDEDFNNRILRGLIRRKPELDIVRVQDAGLLGRGDAEVLQWAATENRVLLTHDVTTMKQHVERRIAAGLPMPGVFELRQDVPIGRAIEDIILLAECSLDSEWEGQVRFLPLG